jgi:hypothetical protein
MNENVLHNNDQPCFKKKPFTFYTLSAIGSLNDEPVIYVYLNNILHRWTKIPHFQRIRQKNHVPVNLIQPGEI